MHVNFHQKVKWMTAHSLERSNFINPAHKSGIQIGGMLTRFNPNGTYSEQHHMILRGKSLNHLGCSRLSVFWTNANIKIFLDSQDCLVLSLDFVCSSPQIWPPVFVKSRVTRATVPYCNLFLSIFYILLVPHESW